MTRSVKNEKLIPSNQGGYVILFLFSYKTLLIPQIQKEIHEKKEKDENVPQRGVPLELERIDAN